MNSLWASVDSGILTSYIREKANISPTIRNYGENKGNFCGVPRTRKLSEGNCNYFDFSPTIRIYGENRATFVGFQEQGSYQKEIVITLNFK